MNRVKLAAGALILVVVSAGAPVNARPALQPIPPSFTPQHLAGAWDQEHVSWPVPPLVRHADVEARLREVQRGGADLFQLEEIGRSVEGRSINTSGSAPGRST